MKLKFAPNSDDTVNLLVNDVSICKIDDIPGFEHVKYAIMSSLVDNMHDTLKNQGINVNTVLPNYIPHGHGNIVEPVKATEVICKVKKANYTIGDAVVNICQLLLGSILMITWMGGIILAHGWWKALSACNPFYAWYLVLEYLLKLNGML